MKTAPSIKLKATFLLIVFLLNTVVGFACSVGVNQEHNHMHHHDGPERRVHKDHQHGLLTKEEHSAAKHPDNCCQEEVAKVSQADKLMPQSGKIELQPQFFNFILPLVNPIDVIYKDIAVKHSRYFVRTHHPPIPDIRIALQSFQI